jgi:hypothetical protein
MQPYYTHGSSRIMTPERRAKLCALLAESHTLEEASEAVGVSIRTVQRERKRDEDFDHEVLLALQKTPDPLKLMEQAARTHWRAAAWLLERQNPEEYARKPVNTTSPKRVATALRFVQEAALQSVPAEFHEALYQRVQAAIDEAFANCFPTMGKWETPKFPKLPIETPLSDVQEVKVWEASVGILHDRNEPGNTAPPAPVDPAEVAAREAKQAAFQAKCAELKRRWAEQRQAELSPKTREATRLSPKTNEATPVACDAPPVDPLFVSFQQEQAVFEQEEQQRELRQNNLAIRRALDEAEQNPSIFMPTTAVVQRPGGRIARLQERQRERAAAKKAKAARKRAAAQRRRAA